MPHSPNATLHAHHMPDLPSIASSSISTQSANTHELLEMGRCASTKGLPLVCPLVGFEGVCLCRLCLLETHWQIGFRATGRSPGRAARRTTGRATGLCLPQFQFCGSALLSSNSNNHLLMCVLRKHHGKTDLHGCKRFADGLRQTRSPSIKGAVCHTRYAWQRHALAIETFSE